MAKITQVQQKKRERGGRVWFNMNSWCGRRLECFFANIYELSGFPVILFFCATLWITSEVRSACVDGCVASVSKGDLMTALLGEGGLWRLKTPIETLDLEADGRPMLLPAGLLLGITPDFLWNLLWCEYSLQLSLDFFLTFSIHPLSRVSGILRWIHQWFCGHRVCFSMFHSWRPILAIRTDSERDVLQRQTPMEPAHRAGIASSLGERWWRGCTWTAGWPTNALDSDGGLQWERLLAVSLSEARRGRLGFTLLFGTGSFGDELFEVPLCNDLQRTKSSELRTKPWVGWVGKMWTTRLLFSFDSHYEDKLVTTLVVRCRQLLWITGCSEIPWSWRDTECATCRSLLFFTRCSSFKWESHPKHRFMHIHVPSGYLT